MSNDKINTVMQAIPVETAKAAPAVGGAWWYHLSSEPFVGALTAVYIIAQLAYLLWKWWREARKEKP